MTPLPASVRVFMCAEPTDMRKSFDGLAALTKSVLGQNPLSGHLFVFVNRRGNYAKCLYYDHGGFCLWAKRLERGTFAPVTVEQARGGLTDTQWRMWLDGIELTGRHQRKRFVLPEGVRSPA